MLVVAGDVRSPGREEESKTQRKKKKKAEAVGVPCNCLPSSRSGEEKDKKERRPMKRLKHVLNLLIKYHPVFGYSFFSLLTAASEYIFSSVVFECPCSAIWNFPYSLVFLLVPALILFLLSCLLSTRAMRLMTGCCATGREQYGCKKDRVGLCVLVGMYCRFILAATMAPITWIAVALLGGGFYECAASGSTWAARLLCPDQEGSCSEQLPRVPCQNEKSEKVQELLKELKAHSQMAGWLLIGLLMIIFLIFTFIIRCQSSLTVFHNTFKEEYFKKEEEILRNKVTECARQLAEENVKCFFDGSQPQEIKIPKSEEWQISSQYIVNPGHPYYSILHKYVNQRKGDCNTYL
ncbi:calcium homeostasis modulator protein 6-like [Antechinus flavipes]|uniref:calcium homeostasis modulator protein 6-like n=1 Tax=Antechinus flavipes TaxID=38775 RepID=UPI0022358ACA|nr:calcium homeostasis modulator protein 6-like [Antechinus flavipes]